ncbi:MAG: LPS export ABC transporter periplasmic protein LptC [Armatimonadota bacterium]|nr:LPS export ABC transporter periplasmic protein LptC [bacterium]
MRHNRIPKYFVLAAVAAAILIASVIAFQRYLPYSPRTLNPTRPPAVVLAMEDVYMVGLGHQGKLWSAQADKVEIGRGRGTAKLTNIHDGKILEGGKPVLNIRAHSAMFDTYRKDLMLYGGVRIDGMDGQQLTGKGATWNSSTGTLRSIGQVTFKSKESNVTTDKLLVDVRNKELSMWKVRMEISVPELEGRLNREAGHNAQ